MKQRVQKTEKTEKTEKEAGRERFAHLAAVSKAFSAFRPAAEVLVSVKAVPTIFVQYDHGTRIGGHPTERITLFHGPSGHGKTYGTLGMMASFLDVDNPVFFVDAERTTDEGFAKLTVDELTRHPLFKAVRPTTYEEVVADVRRFCNTVAAERKAKRLPPDSCGLVVVDSIRKLVPENQWAKILKLSQGEDDGTVRDRTAQVKAMMNAAWCDELVPLLEQTGCTMIIVARETEDGEANKWSKKAGTNYLIGGGKSLFYDASLVARIERAAWVQKAGKEGERATIYGEKHRITITKTKVSGKVDKTIVCYFHTSNGVLVPAGFDRARDVLELARRPDFAIVKAAKPKDAKGGKKPGAGAWLTWQNHRWQGEHAAVKKLTESPDVLKQLEVEVRAKFKSTRVLEVTDDGEVIDD